VTTSQDHNGRLMKLTRNTKNDARISEYQNMLFPPPPP
jgi:hypothetical protein